MDSLLWIRRIASAKRMEISTVLILWHCNFWMSWGTVLVTTTWNWNRRKLVSGNYRRFHTFWIHTQCKKREIPVWKLRKFTLTHFCQKSVKATYLLNKESTKQLIWRNIFLAIVIFSFFHSVLHCAEKREILSPKKNFVKSTL